ncbi:hypothetical protein F8M41_025346 [Gigaspora margarita]|uniref:Uncharacterized protein n=1 Tax=Gigaspora margarita TaxID=4874 RepID=A0A8H4B5A0_GIGMA|nr:hypothetical protein F8M41_025346 [Gigaspora margarita]
MLICPRVLGPLFSTSLSKSTTLSVVVTLHNVTTESRFNHPFLPHLSKIKYLYSQKSFGYLAKRVLGSSVPHGSDQTDIFRDPGSDTKLDRIHVKIRI